jgi:transposase
MALDRDSFVGEAWPVIGRKVSKARLLNDIYETARSSTALPVAESSAAITMLRLVLAEARSLIRQRDQIEKLAHAMLADHNDYQRLCTIPGIGPIHALTILAEAGDLRRFGHHRQFLKFCGLDLATCKYGNASLRRVLWMAAQVAMRQRDNSFRDKLGRYTERDRHDADLRRKAVTALTAKMARVVHAVIKGGAEYRPFFERPVPGGRTSLCVGREGAQATL